MDKRKEKEEKLFLDSLSEDEKNSDSFYKYLNK